jgi:segregation and condensation protein A
MWSNPQIAQFECDEGDSELAVTLFDLVATLKQVLERAKNRPSYEVGGEDVSVPDMIRYLHSVLRDLRRSETVPARELFERQRSRRAMICLFLAILELVRMQAIHVAQSEAFGEIVLKKRDSFDEAFASEEALAALQEEYKK